MYHVCVMTRLVSRVYRISYNFVICVQRKNQTPSPSTVHIYILKVVLQHSLPPQPHRTLRLRGRLHTDHCSVSSVFQLSVHKITRRLAAASASSPRAAAASCHIRRA